MRGFIAGLVCGILLTLVFAGNVQAGVHNCKPAWKCATPRPTLTVTTAPSNVVTAAPTQGLPGWQLIFEDGFDTPIAEGQFPAATNGKWGAYPRGGGWTDTPSRIGRAEWGQYDPAIVSVHDGLMDIRIQTTKPAVNATLAAPIAAGPCCQGSRSMTLNSVAGIAVGDTFRIAGEYRPPMIEGIAGNVVTFSDWPPIEYNHPAGTAVRVSGLHLTATPVPRLPNGSGWEQSNQLYGRYSIRVKVDLMTGFKAAYLLWPTSDIWPRDGEIDYPEANFDGSTVDAFMHHQGGTSGGDQDWFGTDATLADWHTYATEWTPSAVRFYLDGALIGTSTERIPNTPMSWRIQNETSLGGALPTEIGSWHVLVDSVSVWRYEPLTQQTTEVAA